MSTTAATASKTKLQLVVNGEPAEVVSATLAALLDEMGFGGLKVATAHGWFAVRPSGTENVYKLYAESARGPEHLARIQDEARGIVTGLFRAAGAS